MTTFTLLGITKTYPGAEPVHALRGIDLTISPGDFVVVEGPSGSGKSTLLNVLALLDAPTGGRYLIDGQDTADLDERDRARLRGEIFGFVFQGFHLMDHRTVVDNVELGMYYAGVPADVRRERALAALDRVGLASTAHRRASELSGGQRQRVAIARALSVGSGVIVADEPTGNLDTETSQTILGLLRELHQAGTTVVLVTHSPEIAAGAPRRVLVRDGLIVSGPGAAPTTPPRKTPEPVTTQAPRRGLSPLSIARDALASLTSRPGRTAALASSVAVGVALALTTVGLAGSAQAQVSERFDARVNRAVTLTLEVPDPAAGMPVVTDGTAEGVPPDALAALQDLPGVDHAALLTHHDSVDVALPGGLTTGISVFLMGATPDIAQAAELDVRWAGGAPTALRDDEVLLGQTVADALDLGPLDARPAVVIDGRSYVVRGIVDLGIRVTNVAQSVITTADVATGIRRAGTQDVYLVTATGAARQVAQQAPLVLRPQAPDSFVLTVPPDPATLRGEVESDVRTILLVLTGVAILAAVVSLTSTMTMSVLERSREFGMRRAIGARARDVSSLVMTEAALVGATGGAAGAAIGVLALLAITIARRWTPVLDVGHIPLALLGGVAVGMIGGVAASVRARRIQPSEALRS
ncbi:ATP-binding cassette domain-containing protein [Cellulomonas sp. SLBN-39]|uniref:ATP-binding cassette domain-containing protein n=1 Tax=Cellulomonas sp. SLBN-39 TaxID=2768446 RepID=UPI0011538930|nr:ATP-binding cassette domain-containing protein [Cellulomonas sp. SLBN-39]TQL02276.1 macrolide transport system ATP-binding/permease protein [Cellulomonas sp. SLBN-39]